MIKCVVCRKRSGGSKSRQDSASGSPPWTVWVHNRCLFTWKSIMLGVRYSTPVTTLQDFMYRTSKPCSIEQMEKVYNRFYTGTWFKKLTDFNLDEYKEFKKNV